VVTGLRGPYAAARVLPVAFLVALLVARCSDGAASQQYASLPFVIAVFVLPLWYVSGGGRGPWRTAPWALLGVQGVVTYLPFALFGDHWVGGTTGLLMGLVLLVAPRPWALAGLLLVVEGVLWNVVVGVPYLPAVNGGIWVLGASVDNGLGLFGLVRLAQVVGELSATQGDLAAAAVLRERLAVGERLVGAVEERVLLVARHARAALRWLSSSQEDARNEVGAAGRVAREAIGEGRRLPAGDPTGMARPEAAYTPPTPTTAKAVLATVLTMFSLQNVLNVLAPPSGVTNHGDRTLALVTAVVVSVAVPMLHWRHSGPDRPRFWPVTLITMAALSYAQFAFIDALGVIFLAFVCGSVLLLAHRSWRWVWFAAVLVSIPVLSWAGSSESLLPIGYTTAIATAYGLLSYGLSRLTALADELADRRAELARVASDAERLRLARDTHDLLGLGMSTLALKTDLVAALIGRDDQRAARELGEVVRLCATVGADVGRIAGERPELSLASEVVTATEVLKSSGIDVFTDRRPGKLASEVDTVLAIVLREAVTNILRHSAAQRCAITLVDDTDAVTLRIINDGAIAPPADARGRGLANMRARVEALGGSLTTRHERGTFVVVAHVLG
jgi:two-component system sensor histidine kinase DesK